MKDRFGREIDYLRISITDRCNLRCKYCMPNGIDLISMEEILSYEEFLLIAEKAAKLGIKKVKVTGGEPLVRKGCASFIQRLKQIPGIEKVTLTTNGIALAEMAGELKKAGLDAVNVSLDTCDPEKYAAVTGCGDIRRVFAGIDACIEQGIRTKINTVLIKDFNDSSWESMIGLCKDRPLDVRFIEMMPIGAGKDFAKESNELIREAIFARYPGAAEDLVPHGYGPAVYIKIPGFMGGIGFISAVHDKFCSKCNRVRVTSSGFLKQCLSYHEGVDLREILRSPEADMEERLENAIREAIFNKPMEHCFMDMNSTESAEKNKMVSIGG